MFLHLGNDVSVPCNDIIAIFDSGTVKNMEKTVEENIRNNSIFYVDESVKDNPKSYVLTSDGLYVSPISTITLGKRKRRNYDEYLL